MFAKCAIENRFVFGYVLPEILQMYTEHKLGISGLSIWLHYSRRTGFILVVMI